MTFCDSHIHLSQCKAVSIISQENKYLAVSSCHSLDDLEKVSSLSSFNNSSAKTLLSFGIHPQAVNSFYMDNNFEKDFSLLKRVSESGAVKAAGECGFDFFTPELKKTAIEQEEVFERQLELALAFNLPLVLHLRKSIEKIFTYSGRLRKLPSIIFHSFPGTVREALSLKDRGLNAYFSFGKPLLNGRKASIACAEKLPLDCLLLETDAPYQTLKGETETFPSDIKRVYEAFEKIRKLSEEETCRKLEENFLQAFLLKKP